MSLTLSAFKRPTKQPGGNRKLYIIDKEAREDSTVAYAVSAGVCTISGTGGAAFELTPAQNNIAITQAPSDDNDANSTFVTQQIEFTLHDYNGALVDLAKNIRIGRLEALVETKTGKYLLMGLEENGLQSSGGDHGFSGQAAADGQGFTFTLTCEAQDSAPTVTFSEFEAAFDITIA